MYYIPERLAFIPHPRIASRTVWEVVKGIGAIQSGASRHKMDLDEIQAVKDAGGVVACAKRNMFDLLVSFFHMMETGYWTQDKFTKWIMEKIELRNDRYTGVDLYHYGLPHSDLVIEYEDLQGGLDRLMERLGEAPVKIEHVGKSERSPYQVYYTPEVRAAVEERWALDLELTDHKF